MITIKYNYVLMFDKNTRNFLIVSKLFVLRIVTWNHDCLLKIIIIS